jgi:HAD superfamily hydrolase (TIGR01509 family)
MSRIAERLASKQYFVWDFDGCLCDSEHAHFRAYNAAFQCFGHTIQELDYYASFTHLGNGTEREIAQYGVSCTSQEIAALKNTFYRELIEKKEIPLFPEVSEIIKSMRQAGVKVAIASNSPVEEIKGILAGTDIADSFDLIVGRTPELRKKPFPDIFLKALSLLGADPASVAIFEDADKGLEAAAAAGCDVIWMRTRYNSGLRSGFPNIAELTHHQLLEEVRRAFSGRTKPC